MEREQRMVIELADVIVQTNKKIIKRNQGFSNKKECTTREKVYG